MIVKTDEIVAVFNDPSVERDDSPPFSENVGYRERNGGRWFVLDESNSFQETDFVLEDLVKTENYNLAAKVKRLADSKQPKPKPKKSS